MGKLLQKNIGNPLQKISNSLFYNCGTLPHKKTLTRLGKTSHETTAPYKAGLLLWKGYEMKKYIPLDFDEKGKVILGREKNTPTQNGTIPAIFIPGGSDENKQGLKSISISPAITTTPALDSLFPIYWDDLTEEQKRNGVPITIHANIEDNVPCKFTVTPTQNWYVAGEDMQFGGQGEPISFDRELVVGQSYDFHVGAANGTTEETVTEMVSVTLHVTTAP